MGPFFFRVVFEFFYIMFIFIEGDRSGSFYIHLYTAICIVNDLSLFFMNKEKIQDFVEAVLTIIGISLSIFLMYFVLMFAWSILKSLFQIIL